MRKLKLAGCGLLGALAIASLSGCPKGEAEASPSPATDAASSTATLAASSAAAPAAASSASASASAKLPELKPGIKAHEAISALQAAGYVLALGITELGKGPANGAYLEAWDPKAEPKAVFLHLDVVQGEFTLKSVEANPAESLWRQLLPFGPKGFEEANRAAETQAENYTGEQGLELMPRGQDGQTWEAEGGWRIVLAPGDSAELVGPKGGGKLPLEGRWGHEGVVQTLRVNPDGEQLAVVERLPHSKLLACHVLVLKPETKTFGPGSLEGPN